VEKACGLWKGRFQYARMTKRFRERILRHCGSIEHAWRLLNVSFIGRLTRKEFLDSLRRLKIEAPELFAGIDGHKVLKEIDREASGEISLVEILSERGPEKPQARWWRLLVLDNWGSPTSISFGSPFRLVHIPDGYEDTQEEGLAGFMAKKMDRGDLGDGDDVLVNDLVKTLAREFALPSPEVKGYFEVYLAYNLDGSKNANMDRQGFEFFVLNLHGVEVRTLVLSSRFDSMWQAVGGGAETIGFREFLAWARSYQYKVNTFVSRGVLSETNKVYL